MYVDLLENEDLILKTNSKNVAFFLIKEKILNENINQAEINTGMEYYKKFPLLLLEKVEKENFKLNLVSFILEYINKNPSSQNYLFLNCLESLMIKKFPEEYNNKEYTDLMKDAFDKSSSDIINSNILECAYEPLFFKNLMDYQERLHEMNFFEFIIDKEKFNLLQENVFTENYHFDKCSVKGKKPIIYFMLHAKLPELTNQKILFNLITKSDLTNQEMKHLAKNLSHNIRTNLNAPQDKKMEIMSLVKIINNSHKEKEMITLSINENTLEKTPKKRI